MEAELEELRPLKANFDRLLREAQRTWSADCGRFELQAETARREAKEAERRRYSTQQRLESAEEAVHELTDKVAQLNAELLVDVQGGSGAAPP